MIGRNQPCPCKSGKKFKNCHGAVGKAVPTKAKPVYPGPGLIVLMPTRGKICSETTAALVANMDGIQYIFMPCPRKTVIEARNLLARTALKIHEKAPFTPRDGWHVLHIDDDAYWHPGTISRMIQNLPGYDMLAGYFGPRAEYAQPSGMYLDETWPKDFEQGDIVGIDRVGFHFVLHRLDLLERLGDDPFTPNAQDYPDGGGEDFAFCDRVRAIGGKIAIDTGAIIGHVDDDGKAYIPKEGALEVVGGQYRRIVDPQRVRNY